VIIELVGAPGSGKTWARDQVAAQMGASVGDLTGNWGDLPGVKLSKGQRQLYWIAAALRNLPLGWRLLGAAEPTAHSVRLALEVLRRDHVSRRLRGLSGRWVLDEGPVQRLLTYLAHARRWGGDPAHFASSVTLPHQVVWFPVEPEDARQRVIARGGANQPMVNQSRDEALIFLDRYQRFAHRLLGAADVEVVTVDSGLQPPDFTAD
jgi:hypothetical protein